MTKFLMIILALILHPMLVEAISLQQQQQRADLYKKLSDVHSLSPAQLQQIQSIFAGSQVIGQGNPAITTHPVSRDQCLQQIKRQNISYQSPENALICGNNYMVPMVQTAEQKQKKEYRCIDQFEFPNMPCEYPVVWVRANEAAALCLALGKRLCYSHEWEGACAGEIPTPAYDFPPPGKQSSNEIQKQMRTAHNRKRKKIWAYGKVQDHSKCGTNSTKSLTCNEALKKGKSVWAHCGSNTYPTGYHLQCRNNVGVYDQHGNAAEHMVLPLAENQINELGNMGYTEMKGSWFIFATYHAHADDCHWRAPFWHGSKINSPHSHHNYHLGFRCCKTINPSPAL